MRTKQAVTRVVVQSTHEQIKKWSYRGMVGRPRTGKNFSTQKGLRVGQRQIKAREARTIKKKMPNNGGVGQGLEGSKNLGKPTKVMHTQPADVREKPKSLARDASINCGGGGLSKISCQDMWGGGGS